MARLRTEWLARALAESVLLVGSILLALWVDEWAEERQYRELAQQTLGIFEREIRTNRLAVEDAVPFHQGIRDLLQQMAGLPPDQVDVRTMLEGVQPPVLLNTAWETALATGALTHMDVEAVSALSLTYSIQDQFVRRAATERPAARSPAEGTEDRVARARDYVTNLTRLESELVAVYDQALDMIARHLEAPPDSSPEPRGSGRP